jgi:hypothetical protein
MPPPPQRPAPRGKSVRTVESPCAPNTIPPAACLHQARRAAVYPRWRPLPHQVMNISQAERGGNGVSKRMVNQWLRSGESRWRRGGALVRPRDHRPFALRGRVKTKISKTTPCKVRIWARNAALLQCCVRSRRPDVPGQHASGCAPGPKPRAPRRLNRLACAAIRCRLPWLLPDAPHLAAGSS